MKSESEKLEDETKKDTAFPVTQDIPVNPKWAKSWLWEQWMVPGPCCVLVSNPSPLLGGGTKHLWLVPWSETVPDGLTDWLSWTLIPQRHRPSSGACRSRQDWECPAGNSSQGPGSVDRCKWCHGCGIIRLHWSSHVQEL